MAFMNRLGRAGPGVLLDSPYRHTGVDLVKEESLDLVLLKPDFPDKTLIEVIREFSDVPLVVLNHQTNALEPVTALEAGA